MTTLQTNSDSNARTVSKKRDSNVKKEDLLDPQITAIIEKQLADQLSAKERKIEWGKDFHRRLAAYDKKCAHMQDGFLDNIQVILEDQLEVLLKQFTLLDHRVFFESLLHLLLDLRIAQTLGQRLSAVAHFVRSVIPGVTKKCFAYVMSIFQKAVLQDGEEEPIFEEETPLPGESFFTSLKDFVKHKANFAASETWKALQLILSYLFALFVKMDDSVEDSFLKRMLPEIIKPMKYTASAFCQLIESLLHLITKGYQFLKTGQWTSFVYDADKMSEWLSKSESLKLDYANLNSPDASLRKTPQQLLGDFRKQMADGKEISLFLTKDQKKFFRQPFLQMQSLTNDLHNSIVGCKFRKAPLSILLNGEPKVGKTTFTNHLCDFFAKYSGFEFNEDSKYTRNFADPFYSGYKTSHQIMILDDIAFEKSSTIVSLAESSMRDIIYINTNNVLMVNMANLEEKGKVFCAPKLVVGTTNCKHLNALALFETPYAALRRFPYVVTIKPRAEVIDGSGGIRLKHDDPDFQKLIDSVGDDWWHIVVEEPVPQMENGRMSRHTGYAPLLETTSLAEFRVWFKTAIDLHNDDQESMMRSFTDKQNVQYCFKCGEMKHKCSCIQVQDGEDKIPFRTYPACKTWMDFQRQCMLIWQCLKYFYLNSISFHVGVHNIALLLIEIAAWQLFLFSPPVLALHFLALNITIVSYKIYINWYHLGWLLYQYCLPDVWKKRVLGYLMRRNAPAWVHQQWAWFTLAQGLCAMLALYNMTRVYTYFTSQDAECIQHGARKEANLPDKSCSCGYIPEKEKPQENTMEVQGSAASTVDVIADPYYNAVEKSVACDFGSQITSWKSFSESEVIARISQNVVSVTCSDVVDHDGMTRKRGVGLFVSGQVMITNYHLFKSGHKFTVMHPRMNAPITCIVSDMDIVLDKAHDLMAIRFRNIPPMKKITDLFPLREICDMKCSATILVRNKDGSLGLHGGKLCTWNAETEVDHPLLGGKMSFSHYVIHSECTTKNGDCGSPYLVHSPMGPTIVALHQFAKPHLMAGVSLTRSNIEALCSKFGPQVQGGPLIRETCEFSIVPWSPHSNLRQIPDAHFYIFGSSSRRFPSKSRVRKSILYHACIERGFEDEFAAPVMRDRQVWINQAEPMVRRDCHIDHDLLDRAVALFIEEVLDPIQDFTEVHVLTDHDALNGTVGVKYIDKIPRKTSAGFPYNCSKMNFLELLPDGTAVLEEKIWSDAHLIEQKLSEGCRSMPVFMASLKDETVTLAKREKLKTRVFTGSPLAFSLIMRKYLLSINAFIQKRRRQFECCVGVDALGPEWHDIAIYLKDFSPNFVAGDYANYDKTMTPDLILAAGEILLEICTRAGYDQASLRVVRGIVFDIAFPVTNFDGDIVMTCGSEPSGHPLTVIVNSLVGSILMRMAFLNRFSAHSFKENVALIVYGDDNLLSTRLNGFDHTYISKFLETQGLVYTMADKSEASRPFISFEECSFLKRTFEWHEELNRYVGPLAEKSMHKALMYHIPSGAVSEENWAVEVLDTYCREMFFHGESIFSIAREWSLSVIDQLELQECVTQSDFPTYDQVRSWAFDKCTEYEKLPLSLRTFSTLLMQCGEWGEESDMLCQRCGNLDCTLGDPMSLICKRCKHCRPSEFDYSDLFAGCIYCETDYPLMCDLCMDSCVISRNINSLGQRITFYCVECSQLCPWLEQTIPSREKKAPNVCDPQNSIPTKLGGYMLVQEREKPITRGDDCGNLYQTSQRIQQSLESTETNPCVLGKNTREEWYSPQVQDGNEDDVETVSFMDLQPHASTTIPSSEEEVANNMAMDSVSLADFMSRPVLISTLNWAEVDAPGTKTTILPWHLFFNTATIKYKLNNWAFIKCNLHLRIVYNASPFYYGSMMVNWRPLHVFSPSLLYDDSTTRLLIPFSQMPGRVMIEPQIQEDQEIVLPFFWPVNFLRAELASDFQNMGMLYFNIINSLQSANAVVGTGITLKVYAWASDVVLSGPSVGLSMQDGTNDEYKMDGPISKPASAIANIAARLGDLPIIGRFATATQIGATAIAHIAKLFGFTNVPTIGDQQGFQPRALPPIATTDIGFPFEKLTVDSKNELTIDHRSVGLSAVDELPIASIVQRESYLTSFEWTTASAVDSKLFSSAVTPSLWDASGASNQYLYMTPMCWLSTMFDYWRGDVIFRFRVVCSKYHRGRLKLSFDPDGYAGLNVTTDQSSHLIMTKIVDISEETNVEMRIPYQQYEAWLSTKKANTMTNANVRWGTSSFYHERGIDNGNLVVTVQTLLTAPVDPSTIHVQVFVRGAENMDFGSPTTVGLERVTTYDIQDGEVEEVPMEHKNQSAGQIMTVSAGKISVPIDHLYLTYMGERVASLRVLLRRQCKILTHAPPAEAVNDYVLKTLTFPRVPSMMSYVAYGLNVAKGLLLPAVDFNFNWNMPNYLSYISPAFRANRGSVNWSCVFDAGFGGSDIKYFTVVRNRYADRPAATSTAGNMSTVSTNNKFWYVNSRSSGAGALVATGPTSNAANWQMPFYAKTKFTFNDDVSLNYADSSEFTNNDMWTAEWSLSGSYGCSPNSAKLHFYAGAGTDFDLMYFLHVPTYGVLSALPTPV